MEPDMEIFVQMICGGNAPGARVWWGSGDGEGGLGDRERDRARWRHWIKMWSQPSSSFTLIPRDQEPNYTSESMTFQARDQPFVSFHLTIGWGLLRGAVTSRQPRAKGNSLDKGAARGQKQPMLPAAGGWVHRAQLQESRQRTHRWLLPTKLIQKTDRCKGKHTNTPLMDGTFTENFLTSSPQERKLTSLYEKLIEINNKHCVKKLILENARKNN